MLSTHFTLGLPLPLFPSYLPSRITLCMLFFLVRYPYYLHFLFFVDDMSIDIALANCKTSMFVLCSIHGIFSILLSIHISKACRFFVVIKKNKNPSNRFVQIGDIVSIHKNKYPRQRWPLGILTKLIPGKEGCPAATVR